MDAISTGRAGVAVSKYWMCIQQHGDCSAKTADSPVYSLPIQKNPKVFCMINIFKSLKNLNGMIRFAMLNYGGKKARRIPRKRSDGFRMKRIPAKSHQPCSSIGRGTQNNWGGTIF